MPTFLFARARQVDAVATASPARVRIRVRTARISTQLLALAALTLTVGLSPAQTPTAAPTPTPALVPTLATPPVANAEQAPASPLQLRSWAAACSTCHGTGGVAQPGMVSLAGAPKDELFKAMLEFKTGKRPASVMHQISKGYSDDQLAQIAYYFATTKK